MYSHSVATQLKKEFWTAFGQYMAPILSAEGEKISWVNYKTGEKDIFFRLFADSKKATVSIELTHKDSGRQQLYYEQFVQLKEIFTATIGTEWIWQLHTSDDRSKTISRIYSELHDASIYEKEDWPKLITFLKTSMIGLDRFWSNFKYSFELLRS
ncbi:MAG TPA: DUF4268 domain-containing protein [Flavisolibacter sp.]|nr:DUF4268 domain-containing protein [Flavisolibacter sp.]